MIIRCLLVILFPASSLMAAGDPSETLPSPAQSPWVSDTATTVSTTDSVTSQPSAPAPQPGKPPIPAVKKRRKTARIVTVTAIAVGTASSISTYYYMSKGNEEFDRYRHAGNPRDMNRYFNRAEQFDVKAGYSLVAFEISFFLALFSFFYSLEP